MQAAQEPFLSTGRAVSWRALQIVFFAVGVLILGALFLEPALGLHLLWDVLIPVAPALLVIAPGLWRNVCPMGTASLLAYHARMSASRTISRGLQGVLFAGAVLLLLVIVPLRHVVLDTHGPTTGTVLLAVALLAGGLGFVFDARSAWCSGLCPVYPVEMLYGSRPVVTVRNAHCRTCSSCVAPCRDSTPGAIPQDAAGTGVGRWAALVLVGGFPGFVVGWYQVPTRPLEVGIRSLVEVYAWPCVGMLASLLLYTVLAKASPHAGRRLTALFAATAVASYYWFKLPVMLGLGDPASALVDLGTVLPDWSIWPLRAGEIGFFAWLLLARRKPRMWEIQPPLWLART